ncbi:hypothetical protein FXO38_28352 [Capsicum annuum]|nr:hypothetical protein FXO38_28352 [Capsicum annuum]KAF3651741.1 hypothetical protein FXO37_17869 [Capsicum annuum]
MTCLRHCKAVVFRDDSDEARSGSCLLMNEVFSLIAEERTDKRVFLKVQNSSKAQKQSPIISGEKKKSRSHMVIIGSTLAAFFGIIKISAESWGKEDFDALYEGTMSNGIKIAVKRLDGLGHVIRVIPNRSKDSLWHSPCQPADQQQLMDMVDKNNKEMQMHKEVVTEMMSIDAWCLQGDFTKRTSMSLVVKALEAYLRFELATNRAKPLTVQYCLQYYIESNPPKFYYASSSPDSIHFSFDSQTLTALQESPTSPAQFIKLQPDGHLRVYQWDEKVLRLEVISDLSLSYGGNCGYPNVCGRDGICTGDGRCSFPPEENFFMPSD